MVSGLYVLVEGMVGGHVPERRRGRRISWELSCEEDDLGDLCSRNQASRPEFQAARATAIPADDTTLVSGLYVVVEGVVGGHIAESWYRGNVLGPAHSQRYYLG